MTLVVLIAAAVLALAASVYLWLIAKAGTGYKAKVLASTLFVCGREVDPDRAPEISADFLRILRQYRARVDRERKSVTASFLGLRESTAYVRPGFGAVLADAPPPALPELPPPAAPDPSLPWPEGDAAPPETPAPLRAVFEEAFSTRDPRRRTRALLVAREGKILAERYAPGFSRASVFPGWSMSKSAVAALIGLLVERGRLSLDQKALLPEWSRDGRAAITLEDLLRMRSGLRFDEHYANPLSDVVQMLYVQRDMGAFAAAKPLAAPPGTLWRYSSGTTNIVSRLLRDVLGPDYLGFPRRALFEPLGMASAVFETDAAGTFAGSSYLFASARDWARFGLLHLNGGVWGGKRLLPEGWTRFIASPTPQSPGGCYGAHWWTKLPRVSGGGGDAERRLPADTFHALGHEGQCLTLVPSRRLLVVRHGLSIDLRAWDHAAFLASLLDALQI